MAEPIAQRNVAQLLLVIRSERQVRRRNRWGPTHAAGVDLIWFLLSKEKIKKAKEKLIKQCERQIRNDSAASAKRREGDKVGGVVKWMVLNQWR